MAIVTLHDERLSDDPLYVLKRCTRTGIAWIEDHRAGCGVSVHPDIDATGSVFGMKKLGYWRKNDRTVRTHGSIYNIDKFVCNPNDRLDVIVADHCQCKGCVRRRHSLRYVKH